MAHCIQKSLSDFTTFLSSIDASDLPGWKNLLYKKIDSLASQIESDPDRHIWEENFFQAFKIFDLGQIHKRARHKPLGYAGDFLLIDWIYTEETTLSKRGRIFDLLFHQYDAAEAVRNRKRYFIEKCNQLSHDRSGPVHILDIGCGSCRDVLETVQISGNGKNLDFHCIDQEPQAIVYAEQLLKPVRHHSRIHLECTNFFKLKSEYKYDLIWSGGVFDYLDNKTARITLKRLWRHLKEEGEIIFGNFSPENPIRKGMELGCRWYLIHRTANELIDLCQSTGLPYKEIEIESEPLGINLFCRIRK